MTDVLDGTTGGSAVGVSPLRRPSWQVDDCPPWCAVVHEESDHPHDRKHVSAEIAVPVAALAEHAPPGGDRRDEWRATELVLSLHRRDASHETWVYAGDGFEQRIEVLLGDMRRIVAAFEHLMEGLPPEA
ncbi:hypothetical protein H1Q78_08945 [Cellulosimicrobium cellulans]|uniref:DUF6907 domain-containing protein n=1 Tax=Cellulosimicrobium cellulans TaxID=1710 RepID=UPI001EDB78BD|nr:hypothetical protein [Cellulosimicrobium cellulans]UKJ65402.1 hypothetical protein H1Q78_08945 [Cellulosimicrobium cellulans]